MIIFGLRVLYHVARGYLSKPVVNAASRTVDIEFRCSPIDIDIFMHMNNSRYLQNAELSRWRTLPASNLASRILSKEGVIFLAVENKVQYFRPIAPLQRYIVSTTLKAPAESNKWFFYTHTFREHDDDVKPAGGEPRVFAEVICRAVVKQRNGKTLRPSDLVMDSDFFRQWAQME